MKKSTMVSLVVVLILLIVVALIPWIVGIKFKNHYLALIDNVNRSADEVKIKVLEYRVGWLSSTATIEITPTNEKSPTKGLLQLTIEQRICHGPIVRDKTNNSITFAFATIQNKLRISEQIEKLILGNQAEQGLLQVNSIAHFNGDYFSKISTPIFNIPLAGMGKFTWQGLNGDIYFKVENNQIIKSHSEITIGMISAESEETSPMRQMQLIAQPVSIKSDAMRDAIGLWTGSSDISVPGVTVKSGDDLIVSLQNLGINYLISINAGNYNVMEKISMQTLEIPTFVVPSISPANLVLAGNDFNAQAMVNLMQYAKTESNNKIFSDEAKKQQYFTLITKMITPTSNITGDLSITTSLGMLLVNGKAYWPKDVALPTTMDDLYKNTNIKINMRIATALADKLIEKYMVPEAPKTSAAMQSTASQPTPEDLFNKKIADLVQQGKLQMTVAVGIMTLHDKKPTDAEFTTYINGLGLAPDTVAAITQAYAQEKTDEANAKAAQAQLPPTPADAKKAIIDTWIQQNYIVIDKNDYISEVTYESGVLKVNGKVISQEGMMPGPAMMPVKPSKPATQPSATPTQPAPPSSATPSAPTTSTTPPTIPATPSVPATQPSAGSAS